VCSDLFNCSQSLLSYRCPPIPHVFLDPTSDLQQRSLSSFVFLLGSRSNEQIKIIMVRFRPLSPLPQRFQQFLYSFLIIIPLLGVFYYLCLMQSSSEAFDTLVWRLACSLSKEALSRLLLRSGSSVTLIMAIGFALRAFFLATEGGLSMGNYMMPHGAAESSTKSEV